MEQFEVVIPKEPTRIWDLAVPIIHKDNDIYVHITEPIGATSMYDELVFLMDMATEADTFHLRLTTPGGSLTSTEVLIAAMLRTKAKVIGYLSGEVASAGTIITMYCDEIEVAPFTSFMVHYYSGVIGGKGGDIDTEQAFKKKHISDMYKEVYKGFFTPREINRIIKNEDFWLNKEQILTRWARKQEA